MATWAASAGESEGTGRSRSPTLEARQAVAFMNRAVRGTATSARVGARLARARSMSR